ncbi:MAG: LamG-like jellyroll fold domain-containing protein [Planctomycetota bacterium]
MDTYVLTSDAGGNASWAQAPGATSWQIGGNDNITDATTQWLGTTAVSGQPLDLRANGQRAMRLEFGATSPNVIGGHAGNALYAGVYGAAVGGGGEAGLVNTVNDNYGTIGGGRSNTVGIGDVNPALQQFATVSGGEGNWASGTHNVVAGGAGNTASNGWATISGGQSNTASADNATVGGGDNNTASGTNSTVGGGAYNAAQAAYSTIAGGGPALPASPTTTNNAIYDDYGTIGGGGQNRAGDIATPVGNEEPFATVAGGYNNRATNQYAAIAGGLNNLASGSASFIGSGIGNIASGNLYAVVGGGTANTAGASYTTVGGGDTNTVYDDHGTIGGGGTNTVGDDITAADQETYATVGGGQGNTASGAHATVGGGGGNAAISQYATVPGGNQNLAAGMYSFAAGRQAKAHLEGDPATGHNGAFVWADSNAFDLWSKADNEFSARATGGFRFVTGIDGGGVPTAGLNVLAASHTIEAIGQNDVNITRTTTSTDAVDPTLTITQMSDGAATTGFGAALEFFAEDDNETAAFAAGIGTEWTDPATGAQNSNLIFGTAQGGTPGVQMRLTSAGRLGIGDITPGYELDVPGAMRLRGMVEQPDISGNETGVLYYNSWRDKLYLSINGHSGGVRFVPLMTEMEQVGGLEAWWRFEDGTGSTSVYNLTGNNHGTLVNMDPDTDWVEGWEGAGSGALNFAGGIEHVDVGGYKGILGQQARTLTAWVRQTAAADLTIIAWGDNASADGAFEIGITVAGLVEVWANAGAIYSATAIVDTNWHHVAVTWQADADPAASDAIIYLDGRNVTDAGSAVAGGLDTVTGSNVIIGNDPGLAAPFIGDIDDVRLYSKALSALEINGIFNDLSPTSGGTDGGLQLWWRLEGEAAVNVTPDATINGRDGTIAGGGHTWVPGEVDNAINFPAAVCSVDSGATAFDMGIDGDNSRTIALWVRVPAGFVADAGVFEMGTAAADQLFRLTTLGVNNNFRFDIGGATVDFSVTDAVGSWAHIAVVLDEDHLLKIYADGSEVVYTKLNNVNTTDFFSFSIGQNDAGVNLVGRIDDVMIFNRALRQSEIQSIISGQQLGTPGEGSVSPSWVLNGNDNVLDGVNNFLGTTEDVPINVIVGGQTAMRVDSDSVSIGADNPIGRLNVGHDVQGGYAGLQDIALGVNAYAHISDTVDTMDVALGGNFEADASGATTKGLLVAVRTSVRNETTGGTIDDAIALWVDDVRNDDGGTITDTYGLRIGSLTEGNQTNAPYAIYSEDANARTYLAGSVGIGVSAPASALDVQGIVLQGSGTVDTFAAGATVLGDQTAFDTELSVGDYITVAGETRMVFNIVSATAMAVTPAFTSANNDVPFVKIINQPLLRVADAGGAPRMTVASSGNLGAGVTDPGYQVDVEGALRLRQRASLPPLTGSEKGVLYFDNTDSKLMVSLDGVTFSPILTGEEIPVTGRLFGVRTGGPFDIVELDPATGNEIRSFPAPEAYLGGSVGLAYDGTYLWFLQSTTTSGLFKINASTEVQVGGPIAVGADPGGFSGLATMNSNVYVLAGIENDILVYDSIGEAWLAPLNIDGVNVGANISGGLGAITGPDALLVYDNVAGEIKEVDPASGAYLPSSFAVPAPTGVAMIDGQIYVHDPIVPEIDIYARGGAPTGSIAINAGAYDLYALAGDPLATGSGTPAQGWLVEGNSGLVDGTSNLLGTKDATPVDIIVNNTTQMRIEDGAIGIGTSSPTAPLTIQTVGPNEIYFPSTGDNAEIVAQSQMNVSAGTALFLQAGSGTVSILAGGNVGIGTGTPNSALDVVGNVEITGAATTTGTLVVGDTSAEDGALLDVRGNKVSFGDNMDSDLATGNKDLIAQIGAGAEPRLRYDVTVNQWMFSNDGALFTPIGGGTGGGWNAAAGVVRLANTPDYVGIGTSSPTGPLHVVGGTSITGAGAPVTVQGQNALAASNSDGGDIVLLPGAGDGTGASGSVGIGTSTPDSSTALDVAGDVRTTGSYRLDGTSAGYVTVEQRPVAGAGYGLNVEAGDGGAGGGNYTGGRLTLAAGDSYGNRGSEIYFVTAKAGALDSGLHAATASMVIDEAGNVGVGTASPSVALDVIGNVEITGNVLPGGAGGPYDLGSSSAPWGSIWGTVASFHVVSNVGDHGVDRDWSMGIQTDPEDLGAYEIREGVDDILRLTRTGDLKVSKDLGATFESVVTSGTPSVPPPTGRLWGVPNDGSGDIIEIAASSPFSELNRFSAPEAIGNPAYVGLAHDGTNLYFMNGDGSDLLHTLDPEDGSPITAVALAPPGSGFYRGLACLGGWVYVADGGTGFILEVNPATGVVNRTLDASLYGPIDGISGITGPDRLVVYAAAPPAMYEYDVSIPDFTGASFAVPTLMYGAAAVDGNVYTAHSGAPQINVYTRAGALVDQINTPWILASLGGDDFQLPGTPATPASGWLTQGNEGLTDGLDNNLGTLDATPVDIMVNGVTQMRVTDGAIGIGTSSPTAPLTIQATGANEIYFPSSGSNANIAAQTQLNVSSGNTVHLLAGSGLLAVNSSGNVGVGTSSPSAKLDVAGDTEVNGKLTTTGLVHGGQLGSAVTYHKFGDGGATSSHGMGGIDSVFVENDLEVDGYLYADSGVFVTTFAGNEIFMKNGGEDADIMTEANLNVGTTAAATSLTLLTDSAARMTVDSAGNVGIGTTAPLEELHIQGAGAQVALMLDATTDGALAGARINRFNSNGGAGVWFETGESMLWGIGTPPGIFNFSIVEAGEPVDRLTVEVGTGNVGIGTMTPGAKLDVAGTVRATGFTMPTGAAAGEVLTSDASGNASWLPAAGGGIATPEAGLRLIRGSIFSSGLLWLGGGFNSAQVGGPGSGQYRITFTTPFPVGKLPSVTCTLGNTGATALTCHVPSVTENDFFVQVFNMGSAPVDAPVHFTVIGPN